MKRILREMTTSFDTNRLIINCASDDPRRQIWDAYSKQLDKPDWLRQKEPPLVATLTVDFTDEGVYLNRVDAHQKGKGFARELMSQVCWALHEQKGIKHFRAYIESNNYSSQHMVQKLGFEKVEEGPQGDYWELVLNTR